MAKKTNNEEIKQPELNIGLIGHVDHGKTTLLKALSGKWTDTHSEEVKRGITIKLGYADVTFYNLGNGVYSANKPEKFTSNRTLSFVDAPGHETLMATMLSGAAIMDGALLVVAANEICPQPQTREHLMALSIMGIKNIVIVQNKIDLVTKEKALENYNQIKEFVKDTIAENAPIIPISASHNINIDYLVKTLEETIPTPKRDPDKLALMFVARSFDVNRPGTEVGKLLGGVLGGSLKQGVIKVGEKVEISPGRSILERGVEKWVPINFEVLGLMASGTAIDEIKPGGSVAIQTSLDPSIVKGDQLVGSVVGVPGKLPKVWYDLKLQPQLLNRVVGVKENLVVEPIKRGEPLMLNVNSATTAGIVTGLEKNKIIVKLKRPVCADENSKIAISRRIGTRWRLVAWSYLKSSA